MGHSAATFMVPLFFILASYFGYLWILVTAAPVSNINFRLQLVFFFSTSNFMLHWALSKTVSATHLEVSPGCPALTPSVVGPRWPHC